MLVESGSVVTACSEKFWRERLYSQIVRIDPNEAGFVSANGSAIRVLGRTQMEVQESNLKVMHDVLVVSGLVQSFILGNDFLRKHKCDIFYIADVLNFVGGSVSMHIYDAGINFFA